MKLKNSSVSVAICVRDCNQFLPKIFSFLDNIRDICFDLQVVFVENDSCDQTLERIQKYKLRRVDWVHVLSLGSLVTDFKYRAERMAYCRNTYLDYIEKLDDLCPIDCLIVLDVSAESSHINAIMIDQVLKTAPNDWAALMANQGYLYYDIWALRHNPWSPNDIWQEAKNSASVMGEEWARRLHVCSKQIHIPDFMTPLSVRSAFGGAAIYRYELLKGLRYEGLSNSNNEICEHVVFNTSILNNTNLKIYIMPNFVISYCFSQHTMDVGMEWIRLDTWLTLLPHAIINTRKLISRKLKKLCLKFRHYY